MEADTPATGTVNSGIRIDADLWERFERAARAEHRTRNATIGMLIARYVAEHEAA